LLGFCLLQVLKIFEDMRAAELRTNTASVYVALIRACAKRRDWARALEVYHGMARDGVAPDRETYLTLISALEDSDQVCSTFTNCLINVY
jgi:pentatricopeptide repeat protein